MDLSPWGESGVRPAMETGVSRREEVPRVGPVAVGHDGAGALEGLGAGDEIAPGQDARADAEAAQRVERDVHIRSGLEGRRETDLGVTIQCRERQQESRDVLGTHVAGQFEGAALQASCEGEGELVRGDRDAPGLQHVQEVFDGALRQTAAAREGGLVAVCRRDGQQEAQGRTALPAVEDGCLRRDVRGGDRESPVLFPDIGSEGLDDEGRR